FGNINDILKLPPAIAEIQEAGIPIATLPQDERNALGSSFSEELAPGYLKSMGPDFGVSISGGKRFDTDSGTYGATLSFDYDQDVRFEEEDRLLLRLGTGDEIIIQNDYVTERTKLNTNLGGLLALTAEWYNHRLKSNTFWVRDVTEKVEMQEGLFRPSDTQWLRRFLLEYEQRELLMQQFTGTHDFTSIQFDWRLLAANATRELPDRRSYQLNNTMIDGSGNWLLDNRSPNLLRSFSSVDEDTFSGGVDITLPVFEGSTAVIGLKSGFDYDYRDRISTLRQFGFNTTGDRFRPVEQIFERDNIGVDVTFTEFSSGASSDYTSETEIVGGYAQLDFDFIERFRVVAGARLEDASMEVETFVGLGAAGAAPVVSGFEEQKVLPSLVGSWFLSENSQLRAGLSRSLSYPATVEVSATTYVDVEASEEFRGNPDLEPVIIDSADLRWEWYPSLSEALTFGVFYKEMSNPIERSYISIAGSGETISLINADKGEVYGVEVNSYFGLDRLNVVFDGIPALFDNMHIGANFTWQDSEVELTESTIATNPVRRMTGQPDILLNLQLGYTGIRHVVTAGLSWVGKRLITAGINDLPDEFLEPHMDLGVKWSYTPIDPLTISLELENLLNDSYQRSQEEFFTRAYKTGITGKLGLSWRFDFL
ncbi:MAG: TonB-dependent receptor, partial [Pseudomonadales bacterium]